MEKGGSDDSNDDGSELTDKVVKLMEQSSSF